MHIDFEQALRQLDGKIMMQRVTDGEFPLTLREVCIGAVNHPQGMAKDGKGRNEQYQILIKVQHDRDLESEEIAELKRAIGLTWPPVVVGQAWALLEGKETGIVSTDH